MPHQRCTLTYLLQGLVDNLVPGDSPLDLLRNVRVAASERATRAQTALQALLPMDTVAGLVGMWNSTVDGLLGELAASSDVLRVSPSTRQSAS
jgi:hypothetical protein